MSTEIEQRVVEMRFDNKHFESNVSTTMSTLDKLKQKLHLDGATKGLEGVTTAAKKVDMSSIGVSAEKIGLKFNAMYTIADQAFRNITNSAMAYSKRIVKSLTVDPIKSGFEEYETKMGSIQTILANTEHQGTTLDDVTASLEELNRYADKTIYNFQQMTKNIGTFTAAGVDLQKSTKSIQGIANLAAVSGSTSQQASTAMYQLSQALASGTVKLMDWNSVVNAGMGGKVFQNALIRTAAVLDGASADVAAWQKENIDAYGSFRESLSQGAWLTADVLTATLEQFTMAAEEGSDEWNAFKKSLMDTGYTEKQAEEILKMANTATDAATKVKTFTQLMDTLKESAQSGWAQTWELIVGDFEEAKEFFTGLSDLFGGIIGKSADRRNTFLGEALSSNWDKLTTKLLEAGIKTDEFEGRIRKIGGDDLKLDDLITEYGSLEKAIRKGAISSDILKKALDDIAGTNADGKIAGFVDGLKEIERILGRGSVGEDVKKLQTALDELGYDLGAPGIDGIIGPITEAAIKAFQEANGIIADGVVGPETMKALEAAGKKVEETAKDVDGLTESCGSLIDVITEKSGRELILDSLMNIIKAIQRPLAAVGEALRDIFSISPDQLYNALEKVNQFTEKLVPKGILEVETWTVLTDKVKGFGVDTKKFEKQLGSVLKDHGIDVDKLIEKYGSLGEAFEGGAISFDYIKEALLGFEGITEALLDGGETVEKVRRTFAGLFAVFDIIGTVLAGPVKLAFKVFTEVLERLGLTVLDFTAGIGDSFVKFRDKVDGVIDTITEFIVDNVSKWIEAFKETEFFKTIAGWFEDASKAISDALDNISIKISNLNASKFMEYMRAIYGVVHSLAKSVVDSELFQTFATAISNAFGKLKEALSNLKLPEFNLDYFKNFSQNLVKIGEKIGNSGGGFLATITGFFKHIKDNVISWNWTVFKETALEKFTNFILKTGDKVKAAFEKGKEIAQAIKRFIFGAEEVNLPNILGVVERFLGIMVLIKSLSLMNAMVEPFDNITDALNNFAASVKWKAISGAFKSLALALAALTVCILVLSRIPDQKAAWSAAGMLLALMLVMGAVVTAMGIVASKTESGLNAAGVAGSLLMMIGAIVLLVYAIKQIDDLKLKNPGKTFLILAGVLLSMSLGIKMVAKAAGTSFRSVAAILTLMAALKMMLDIIDAYDQYNWAGKGDAIIKAFGMLVGISAAINLASRGIKAGANASGMAAMILAMVISLKLMVGVIEDFGNMETSSLVKGTLAISYLLMMLTGVAFVLGKANDGKVLKKGQKNVNNFTGLAIALLAVVGAIWLLSKMANNDLKGTLTGLGMVVVILGALGTMFWAIGKAWQGVKAGPIWAMIAMIVILAAAMTASILILKNVPWQNAAAYMGGLAAVVLTMGASLKMMASYDYNVGKLWGMIGAMAALGLIVAGLSIVIRQMNGIPWQTALAYSGALSILLGTMAGVLFILSNIKVTGNMTAPIGALGLLGLVVLELGVILGVIHTMSPGSRMDDVIAISTLLVVMTGVLAVVSLLKVGGDILAPIAALVLLGAIVLELGFVLSEINKMNIGEAMPAVKALSALILVLTVVLAALTGLGMLMSLGGSMWGALGTGVAVVALAALGLVVWELGGILNAMKSFNLGEAGPMVDVLSKLILTLTGVLAALTVMGLFGASALMGVVSMAALGLVVWELGAILNAMREYNLGDAMPTINALSTMLNNLVEVMKPLTVIGVFAVAAIAGVAALTTLITVLGGLILMIGAMASKWEGIETAIDKGIEILNKIATGLGAAIGGFIDSLLGSIGSGLVSLGEQLSMFMTALLPFIVVVRSVDDSVIKGAGNLAAAIIALLAADLISKIADILPGGGLSLTDLAVELTSFAGNIGGFISAMKEIDPDTATGVKSLCDAISTLTTTSFWDTLGDKILGGDSLSSFGTSISDFATCIKDASVTLKGITDEDVENIKRSAAAGQALSDLNQAIPRSEGWLQDLIGKKDLASFGESANAFADCLVSYSEKVSGKNIDAKAIENSATAAQYLVDVANNLPSSGGIWQEWIAGEKSLSQFGATLVSFGDCLVNYSNKVSGKEFDADAIVSSAEAGAKLADVAKAIPSSGGVWQEWITGEKNLATFGKSLTDFGKGILDYSNVAVQIDQTKIDAITNSGTAVDELVKVIDKVPTSGGWGEKILGSSDGQSFGYALSALANGITDYCATAATIGDDDITAIQNSKTAVTELGNVLNNIPDSYVCGKASILLTAVNNIKTVADTMSLITANGYDYSGLASIKVQITGLNYTLGLVDADAMKEKAIKLYAAVTNVKYCAQQLSELDDTTYTGIDNFKNALTSLAGANMKGVIDAFSGKGKEMADSMVGLVKGMARAISDNTSEVTYAMTSLVGKVVKAAEDKARDFKEVGKNFVAAIASGIGENKGRASEAGVGLGAQASSGAAKGYIGMHSAGQFLGAGLALGIASKWQAAYDAGYSIGQAAVQGEKAGQESNSPSKATIKAGKWLGEGLVIGIGKTTSQVYNAGADLGKTATGTISSAVAKVADMVSSGIDAQPTIRPVLDLSDVEAGMGIVSGMLSSPMGALSMSGRINTSMNARSQNGGNGDVVSAIDKLNKKMDNLGNTTYQINGVTYDDGSNIATAVKTIVHAARRERRV